MSYVECDRCGTKVDKRGLQSHKGSKNCDVQKARRKQIYEYDRLPLKTNSDTFVDLVIEHGGKCERAPFKVEQGNQNRATAIKTAIYGTRFAVEQAMIQYLPGAANKGRKLNIVEKGPEFVLLKDDEDLFFIERKEKANTGKRKLVLRDANPLAPKKIEKFGHEELQEAFNGPFKNYLDTYVKTDDYLRDVYTRRRRVSKMIKWLGSSVYTTSGHYFGMVRSPESLPGDSPLQAIYAAGKI